MSQTYDYFVGEISSLKAALQDKERELQALRAEVAALRARSCEQDFSHMSDPRKREYYTLAKDHALTRKTCSQYRNEQMRKTGAIPKQAKAFVQSFLRDASGLPCDLELRQGVFLDKLRARTENAPVGDTLGDALKFFLVSGAGAPSEKLVVSYSSWLAISEVIKMDWDARLDDYKFVEAAAFDPRHVKTTASPSQSEVSSGSSGSSRSSGSSGTHRARGAPTTTYQRFHSGLKSSYVTTKRKNFTTKRISTLKV
jgi:hypothetical protein